MRAGFAFASIEPEVVTESPDSGADSLPHPRGDTNTDRRKLWLKGTICCRQGSSVVLLVCGKEPFFNQTAFEKGIDKILVLYSERGLSESRD